ncbi:Gfo/Idh/MocA family protein [Stakelama saccharophila]|uniref:Gfo/Idh/MocA family oxidoreductase n=1 Tax=Stakelama saccharophila TaxID=3075605 RepID=A0ABZ0BCT3_9SPHN|nr:Gfo/Idh/MocA family oxidoreductase [Stakelama sp. W311]WNO54099.1 Gfo/Idh/MocA family oxidoreductase [Stakelama sp. W311]
MIAAQLQQHWPMPAAPRPIVIIGTGGIVKDAHLPAYRKAGFTVAGLFDRDRERAQALADEWRVPRVFASIEEAADQEAVFDIAAPPVAHADILRALPGGANVLLQKPMGLNLEQATRIRDAVHEGGLTAAVNFQLRYSAMMLGIADAIRQGRLGELVEIEVHINLVTPWHLFPHLKANPRVEIVSHSIHYLDTIRALAGDPTAALARSFSHPSSELTDTRTSIILDYDRPLRVTLSINHHHDFGRKFQDASFRVEGTEGAAMAKLGVLLDYPAGEPDELWLAPRGGPWEQVPLSGAWFPDAFIGPMANLQRFAGGEDDRLATHVDDAWRTMALVESCYRANRQAGTPVPAE